MPNGQEITLNTGRYAKQADGSVVLRCGDTVILATVCSATEVAPETDFFPLSVDYREKYYATGKFPGGFFKREAKPSDYEVLISRLIDRALRPLFPDDYHAETIVQVNLLSNDKEQTPDALAALAASAAICVSDIPFHGPISEVRVALIGDEYVINPTFAQMEEARLELMVAASMKDICMVEGECKEVSEQEMLGALKAAHEAIKIQCQAQLELMEQVNKAKREYCHEVNDDNLRAEIEANCYQPCYDFALTGCADKHLREETFSGILDKYLEKYTEEELETVKPLAKRYFHDVERSAVRNAVLNERIRLDGRKTNEVRPIWTEVDVLPKAHGSAVFTRGETQALVTVTLGTKLDEQTLDGAVVEGTKNFTLHYNFPGFATGEAKAARSTSRREIGHGNLAERALKTMVPHDESMPYTIRIVSDILESNGSSSMASVCGGCLALMDAGVPMRKPVAGVAMGMISDSETGKYAILTDILGDEDHLGDMDFKVTGTRDGITACQMDIKVDGLSYEVLSEALEQARQGRLHILDEMAKTITEPRSDYKEFVPRIETYDRCRHRPWWQGHPRDAEADQHRHRHHRRRAEGHRGDRFTEQGRHRSLQGQDQGHRASARGWRSLPRQDRLHHGLRCLRGDHPQQGRPAPYLGDRLEALREHGRDRLEGRRRDRCETHRNRREDRQVASVAPRPSPQAGRL